MPSEEEELVALATNAPAIEDEPVETATEEAVAEKPSAEGEEKTAEKAANDDGKADEENDDFAFLGVDLGSKPSAVETAAPSVNVELEQSRAEIAAAKAEVETLRRALAESEGAPVPNMDLINPDSPNYDPDAYNKQMFKYQTSQAEKMHAQQSNDIETRAKAKKFVAERDAQLLKEMPFLFQGEKGRLAAKAILGEAVRNGLPENEVWALTAPMIKTFYNSLQWQAAKAAKAAAVSKASEKDSPKPIKTEKSRDDKAGAALERLMQTGSREDAIAAYIARG
jgi:hypothetical protein